MDSIKIIARGIVTLLVVSVFGILCGCEGLRGDSGRDKGTPTVTTNANPIAVGDKILVSYNDLSSPIAGTDTQVKEDGMVTLIYNKSFMARGKTVGELETEIRAYYVPRYFVNMTPTVKIMDRYYSVDGEVKTPGPKLYTGRTTVLTAIAAAGGFTDYARHGAVLITRANGKKLIENADKALGNPDLDIEIFPGDLIYVKKRVI